MNPRVLAFGLFGALLGVGVFLWATPDDSLAPLPPRSPPPAAPARASTPLPVASATPQTAPPSEVGDPGSLDDAAGAGPAYAPQGWVPDAPEDEADVPLPEPIERPTRDDEVYRANYDGLERLFEERKDAVDLCDSSLAPDGARPGSQVTVELEIKLVHGNLASVASARNPRDRTGEFDAWGKCIAGVMKGAGFKLKKDETSRTVEWTIRR